MAVLNGVQEAEEMKQRGDAAFIAGMHADAVMLHCYCYLPCATQQTGVTHSFCIAACRHLEVTFDDHVHAGDFAAAAAAFAAGLAGAPQEQPLHKTLAANLSAAHERLGDFPAALQAANAAVAAAPLWSKAYLRCRMHTAS
jgi:hypothetical protein